VSPRVSGIAHYDDGAPARSASIVATDLSSGAELPAAFSDGEGRFILPIKQGEFALAAAAEQGFAWLDRKRITDEPLTIELTRACHAVSGRITGYGGGEVLVKFGRHSSNTGDTFVTKVRDFGQFSMCLPAGEYTATLAGDMLSSGTGISVPRDASIALQGYRTSEVKRAPEVTGTMRYDVDALVEDVQHANPLLVGLGEASHGSAEFVTQRSKLTFVLARRTGVELILLENDAISAFELERYVMGEDVDIAKAVADLKFWISDTYEFIEFMKELRKYNASNSLHSIHVWGIDVQNTSRPVSVLLANARQLTLSSADQELLEAIAPARAKAVKEFPAARRAALDAMLLRLSVPMGSSRLDTLLAVAARSLSVQVGYMDGDSDALYDDRRDNGWHSWRASS
jgi:erythromycin esterase